MRAHQLTGQVLSAAGGSPTGNCHSRSPENLNTRTRATANGGTSSEQANEQVVNKQPSHKQCAARSGASSGTGRLTPRPKDVARCRPALAPDDRSIKGRYLHFQAVQQAMNRSRTSSPATNPLERDPAPAVGSPPPPAICRAALGAPRLACRAPAAVKLPPAPTSQGTSDGQAMNRSSTGPPATYCRLLMWTLSYDRQSVHSRMLRAAIAALPKLRLGNAPAAALTALPSPSFGRGGRGVRACHPKGS